MVTHHAQESVPRRLESVDRKPLQCLKKEDTVPTPEEKRYPYIKKLPGDPRQYRGLELPNGLRVLLVFDPSRYSCAASLDVHVGACANPESIPGIAHLCEHTMLFGGSERYPEKDDFFRLVSNSCGFANASTIKEWTNYYFEVRQDCFWEVLDHFIHLFVSPLFAESSIESEIEAVDSEFRNGQKMDDRRLARLCNVLSRPGHDISKFGTGNRQTLMDIPKSRGINIRDEVVKFYENHYSSNVMSLCIVGPYTLSEFEEMILSIPLHEIPNRNVNPTLYREHYYGSEETGFRVDVVSVKNQRRLTMKFAVEVNSSHLESRPDKHVCKFLAYQGKGSLAHELKQRGWSKELGALHRSGLSATWTEITVWIDLSKQGLEHVEEIVELLFLYIGLLRRNEPCEQPLSNSDATSIEDVTRQLTPRKMIYFVTTKENSTLEGLQMEHYYGIEYRKTTLENALVERFERALETESELFWMPEQNRFLAEMPNKTADAKRGKQKKEKVRFLDERENIPREIDCDEFKRIWHLEDRRPCRPFAKIEAFLTFPNVAVDPQSQVIAQLFVQCFEYQTRAEFYDAERAGLKAKVATRWHGLKFDFCATDDRTCQVVGDYIRKLVSFEPQRKEFAVVLDALRQEMRNFDAEQPYDQGERLLDYVLTEGGWPTWKLLQASDLVTFETLVDFMPTMWSALHFELLARGRLTEDEVARLCSDIVPQNGARGRPLSPEELKPLREMQIPAGVSYFYEHKQAIHPNNCVVFFLQVEQDPASCVLLEFLVLIMREPALHTLRTTEHLGYVVTTERRKSEGTKGHGLCLTVQGACDPEFVEERIEAFLENFEKTLLKMSWFDIWLCRHAVCTAVDQYWEEIETKSDLMKSELKKVTIDDVVKFYKEKIMADSEKRQKVSIWVRSTIDSDEHAAPKNGLVEIKDLEQFKTACPPYDWPEKE
ncbi:hypothetical protein QR680_018614 [Steinernema hermaphroditum]|uniref:Peptidase M16 N-terminal domain-containing protein n=1 Tax=Steinernema hermaphroditum TaxID=289476 RepID=A0AA39LRD5_9BILA|nr:hypothetical protein QR680_018614 [Steinernema hermaphroditum]